MQVAEARALHRRRFGAERGERVRDAATRQVGRRVESASIAIRASHSQAGAAGDDDVRVERADVVDGQPRAFQHRGQPIGQEHICAGKQAAKEFTTGLGLDVDRNAALAAVPELEDEVGVHAGGFASEAADNQGPARVAGGDAFYLDNVGAPVRQRGTRRGHVRP